MKLKMTISLFSCTSHMGWLREAKFDMFIHCGVREVPTDVRILFI